MKDWIYWHINSPLWFFCHRNLMPKLRGDKPIKWGIYLSLLSVKWWKNFKRRLSRPRVLGVTSDTN